MFLMLAGHSFLFSVDCVLISWTSSLARLRGETLCHWESALTNMASTAPQLIRRWRTGVCGAGLLSTAAPALYCHNHPVRTLAAGSLETLVSGDSSGVIGVWRV